MGIQTTPSASARRADIIQIGSVGITGHAAEMGYRRGYTYPGSALAFDFEVGALDAPQSLPAGSTRSTISLASAPASRCISSAWYRR